MDGSCKSFTCSAGLVLRGPDLETHIHSKWGEGILASQFLVFHCSRLASYLVILHRNVDLESTSCLLLQVNFSSSILKLVKIITVASVTKLLPPLTLALFLSRFVGQRVDAEDDNFQGQKSNCCSWAQQERSLLQKCEQRIEEGLLYVEKIENY